MTGMHCLSMFAAAPQGLLPRAVQRSQLSWRSSIHVDDDIDDRLANDIGDRLDDDVDDLLSLARPERTSDARKMDAKSGIVIALPAN